MTFVVHDRKCISDGSEAETIHCMFLWLWEPRWPTCIACILYSQRAVSLSSLYSYSESVNCLKCLTAYSLVFSSGLLITALNLLLQDFIPQHPTVFLCHCAPRKEFSPNSACQTPRSNTDYFLHCFQISGAMDRAALLTISLADLSNLRILAYSYPLTLLKTPKYPLFMQTYFIPPRSPIKQNPVFSRSYLLC